MGCRARRTLGFKVSLNARYRGGTFPLQYLVKLAAVRSDKFTTAVSNWGEFLVVVVSWYHYIFAIDTSDIVHSGVLKIQNWAYSIFGAA